MDQSITMQPAHRDYRWMKLGSPFGQEWWVYCPKLLKGDQAQQGDIDGLILFIIIIIALHEH